MADGAFAEGFDVVPLDEIARRAALGRATVYRHFGDRHALAVAVASRYFEALRQAVGAADERRSFRDLLRWVLSTQASMRPLVTLLRELPVRDRQQHSDALIGILTPAFRRAQEEGELRSDVEPADLALVMAMLDAAADAPIVGGDHKALQRLIAVLLDGLFTPDVHREDQEPG